MQHHQFQATKMDGTSWYVFYGCVLLHLIDHYTLASMLTHCERYLQGLPVQIGYWHCCIVPVD